MLSSSGLLGAALVTVLRGVGVSVRGLDVLAAGTTDVQGSVADAAVVERAVQGCKAIFHTASLHHPDDDTFSESDFVRINVHGTQLLLDFEQPTRLGEQLLHDPLSFLRLNRKLG